MSLAAPACRRVDRWAERQRSPRTSHNSLDTLRAENGVKILSAKSGKSIRTESNQCSYFLQDSIRHGESRCHCHGLPNSFLVWLSTPPAESSGTVIKFTPEWT